MVERRGRSFRVGVWSTFDGEPRDDGHCFEEAPDNVRVLGEQCIAESLKGERAKWMRSIEARARFAMRSSVIGLLCSICVTVMSRG